MKASCGSVTRHSWRTVSPPTPESKTPTGRGSIPAIVEATPVRLGSRLVRRCLVVLSLVALALVAAAPAGAKAFSKTDSLFSADDGVKLADSYYEPTDVARPAAGFPAVMVFHGLG